MILSGSSHTCRQPPDCCCFSADSMVTCLRFCDDFIDRGMIVGANESLDFVIVQNGIHLAPERKIQRRGRILDVGHLPIQDLFLEDSGVVDVAVHIGGIFPIRPSLVGRNCPATARYFLKDPLVMEFLVCQLFKEILPPLRRGASARQTGKIGPVLFDSYGKFHNVSCCKNTHVKPPSSTDSLC